MALPNFEKIYNELQDLSNEKSVNINSVGWYRIAKITGTGHPASTAILSVSTSYNYSTPSSVLISVITTYQKAKTTQLNAITENSSVKPITKIRIIWDSSNSCFWIDAYYTLSTNNPICVKNENLLKSTIEILTPTIITSTSGTVLQELTITY